MLNNISAKFLLVSVFLALFTTTCLADNKFSQFEIKQGKGEFTQQKRFTFLKRAIKSQGEFVIFEQQVYWHTRMPVQSELLILAQGIYRRSEDEKKYQIITQDEQINQLLASLLSGQIQSTDWQISPSKQSDCYELIPVLSEVALMFKQVKLCRDNDTQRDIVITDQQNNTTQITMQITSKELSQRDKDSVKLTN